MRFKPVANVIMILVIMFSIIIIGMSIEPYMKGVDAKPSGEIVDTYVSFYYNGTWYHINYELDVGIAEYYIDYQIPRSFNKSCYSAFASQYDIGVRNVAEEMKILTKDMNDVDTVNMVSKLVNVIVQYKADEPDMLGSAEYYQYPEETLYLRTGDCEDYAILTVAILREMGYDAEVLVSYEHSLAGVNVNGMGKSTTSISGARYYTLDSVGGNIVGDYDGYIFVMDRDVMICKVLLLTVIMLLGFVVLVAKHEDKGMV